MKIITDQFVKRNIALPYEELGEGLYGGEIAVQLSSGEKIAISVEPKWLPNGSGVSFIGNARWIDDNGQTHIDPIGEHAEANIQVTATMQDVTDFGVAALAKDVAVILLGEGSRLMRPAKPEFKVESLPVFMIDPNTLAAASIENTLNVIKETRAFKALEL